MKGKKGVTIVVSIALLLLVSLGIFFLYQGWFTQFESSQRAEVLQGPTDVSVNKLERFSMTITSSVPVTLNNISFYSLESEEIVCELSSIKLDKGTQEIDYEDCDELIRGKTYEITIVAPNFTKQVSYVLT